MPLASVPKEVLRVSLHTWRLPLSAAEAVARRVGADPAQWPPAVAYESFEGSAKQVVGTVLRDEDLVEEGRMQRAKATELRQAETLDAEADRRRAQARSEADRRHREAASRRRRIEQDAQRQEKTVEKRAEAEKKAAATRRRNAANRQRRAEAVTVAEKAEALDAKERALEATGEVIELDQAAEAVRQQRSS